MSVFQDGPKAESVQDSVETTTNSPQERKPLTFSQWQDIRRQHGSRYYTPAAQKQMLADAQALGDAFLDQSKVKRNPWD